MKTYIGFAVAFLALGLTIGCSNSGSSNNNNAANVYGNGTGGFGTGLIGSGNPNQVILATQTAPNITDPTTFRKYMRSIGICSLQFIDTCSGAASNPPYVEVAVDDYTLAGGGSTGSMVFEFGNGLTFGYGPPYSFLAWRATTNNTAFETQQVGIPGYPNYNMQLLVSFTGKTTDSQIPYQISFGGAVFATGVATRVNTP